MTVRLNPYLNFRAQAKEAMTFYQSVLGGSLEVTTFGEGGMADDPAEADLVMHAMLTGDNGLIVMGADVPAKMEFTPGNNSSVSLSGDDEAVLTGFWEKLTEGADIWMPLAQAPWGDSFGMLKDRFGVQWMVNITGPANAG